MKIPLYPGVTVHTPTAAHIQGGSHLYVITSYHRARDVLPSFSCVVYLLLFLSIFNLIFLCSVCFLLTSALYSGISAFIMVVTAGKRRGRGTGNNIRVCAGIKPTAVVTEP